MFKFYFSLKKYKLGKPTSRLSNSWRNFSSNQALSHCLGSCVIVSVTVTAKTLTQGNRSHIYSPSTTLLLFFEYCPQSRIDDVSVFVTGDKEKCSFSVLTRVRDKQVNFNRRNIRFSSG